MKTNFTKDESQIYDLALDLMRDEVDLDYTIDDKKITKKDLENYLRDKINNELLGGLSMYQAIRRNKITLCEIIEEVVNTVIDENVVTSPFFDMFVEYRNRGLNDRSAFEAEESIYIVSKFAGNHWDTNRQAIKSGEEIILPKEWVYIHLYDELERFLAGVSNLAKIADIIFKSISAYIKDRLYAQFELLKDYAIPELTKQGNDEEAVSSLCDTISGLNSVSGVIVAGTKPALRKLLKTVPDKFIPESMKEAKQAKGTVETWDGTKVLVIPPSVNRRTFKSNLSDDTLFILADNGYKPIKFESFNDSRTKFDTEGKNNADQTVDMQVQTALGMGIVIPKYFGVFKFA